MSHRTLEITIFGEDHHTQYTVKHLIDMILEEEFASELVWKLLGNDIDLGPIKSVSYDDRIEMEVTSAPSSN